MNKRKAYYFGLLAEFASSIYLRFKLYKILLKRHKTPFGEIDLIARKGNIIIFFEVKARKDTKSMDFIGVRQKNRIINAAQYFLLKNPKYKNYNIRFDVIIMNKYFIPLHFQSYW
ncbi:MAG: YraN family protein [Pseudomonadota bacterium]